MPASKPSFMLSPLFRIFFLAATLLVCGSAAAATVRAYIQPEKAQTGQVVTYVIAVQNGTVQSLPQLRLPSQVQMNSGVSTSQNIEIRGNQRVFATQLAWGVAATEPGEFVIPPQEVLVNGEILKTNEVRLTVTEAPATPGAGKADDATTPLFQIEVGKTEFYPGEVVPITASLFVPRSVMLRRVGLIQVDKTDFAITRFPQQADQTETVINGIGYMVITYRSVLSALQAGELKVGPASCELLYEVYEEDRGGIRRSLPFGMIMGNTETRKMVVKSQEVKVNVLPLPTEGKPAKFTGAVGDFNISASATPDELTVGDPLAVDVTISGSGSFDAIEAPALVPPDGWKAYPPRRYNVDGPVNPNLPPATQSTIGFSMVFVPEKVLPELPPFEFTFFSPTQKKYITARTPSIPLVIKPGAIAAATGVAQGGAVDASAPPAVQQPKPNLSDILMTVPSSARWLDTTIASTTPLTASTRFWALQSVPAALVILATLFTSWRRRRERAASGLRGELQQLWRNLEEPGLGDREFLQRAAHFIHRSHAGREVQDEALRDILRKYEDQSFTAAPASPGLDGGERGRILQALSPLMKQAALILCALGLFSTGALGAEESSSRDDVYRQACEALEKGKFTQAQYLGESLTKKDPPALSAAVFSLIGHARYRQDDLGRAALWYQRAELLEPANPEVRQNLRHLDEKTRFFRFGQGSLLQEWSLLLSRNTWIIAASAGVWIALLALLWFILSSNVKQRGGVAGMILIILGLMLFLPAAAFAAIRPEPEARVKDVMIVTAKDVSAFTAATITSGSVIDLPPGSQVRLLEKRGAWSYVEIPGGGDLLRGWIETPVYTPLWPWKPELLP
ncbi:MAG: BatD family protein [Prosthecobacter sp.]